MTPEQIKENLNKYKWEQWLTRPFGAFIMSLFTRNYDMRNIGIDVEMIGFVFQKGSWYSNHEIFEKFGFVTAEWMEKNQETVFDISNSCKSFYEDSKENILKMISGGEFGRKEMEELKKIFQMSTNYVWLTNGLEVVYTQRVKEEVPKYYKGNVELFIGDISFPDKKTAHTIFEEKLRGGGDLVKIQKEFGWLRVRDGFAEPFNLEELKQIKEKLKEEKHKPVKKIKIPKELKPLVKEIKELVFQRTYRTDVLYELLFLARPILKKYGENLGLEFKEVRNCRIDDLINGVVKKYPEVVTVVRYKSDYAFFDENVVPEQTNISQEIKGSIAFMGITKGIVKIVRSVKDLPDVKDGDILVTNMTTPNYLVAMKRAVAFVTDEGGITCHAAIVAREMKKPCIIGTKNATKILKDGDLVEVDAEKGIVRIIK